MKRSVKATVNLDGLHKLSSFHRAQVLAAPRVGCFFCLRFSKPRAITEWIDARSVRMSRKPMSEGQTALCPQCDVDAVLPDRTYGFRLTPALLVAMHERFFCKRATG